MLLSLLLFAVTLSLLEMYRAKFASSELMTIAGGFVCSLLFLLLLTVRPPLLVPVLLSHPVATGGEDRGVRISTSSPGRFFPRKTTTSGSSPI